MNWRYLVVVPIVAVLFVAAIPLKNMLFESSGNVDSLGARASTFDELCSKHHRKTNDHA